MGEESRIFVGTSGWSYPDWQGVVYPAPRPRGFSELTWMAGFLDAVELNMSFYRPPTPAMSEKWVRLVEANPDFRFTAKLWQRFTHQREQAWSAAEARQFKKGIAPLRESGRFGALLVQFPWSFAADGSNYDWLARIADEFRDGPAVVEVRHASWATPEGLDFLKQHALNFCNIDQPRSSTGIGRTSLATGSIAYYRFHGRNRQAWFKKDAGRDEQYNYLYSEGEIKPWAGDIAEMAGQVKQIYVMNNNHYRGQAAVNALQIKSYLSGKKVAVPEPLLRRYPVLESIAVPAGGQERLPF